MMELTHLVFLLMIVVVLAAKKKSSWRATAEKAQVESSGQTSFFWSAELDQWHEILVYPNTIEVRAEDPTSEKDAWKKRTYVEISNEAWNDGNQTEEEVPFWCTEDFFDELLSSPEDSGSVLMKYKRTKSGDKNRGKFRLSESD